MARLFGLLEVERHLVWHYVTANELSYDGNDFLTDYFHGFTPQALLLSQIEALGHTDIGDIAVDMELLIPQEDKRVNGAFFTPTYIVDYIIRQISPKENARVADLSCGSGAFLLGIVRYYRERYGKSAAACIRENVFGADILAYNIKRSKVLLALCALRDGESVVEEDFNLVCCDSLKHKWKTCFDAIVGNPPYVKFQDMDDTTRTFLMQQFKTTTHGTYNLYFAFFELGLQLLSTEGQLGYITPNNYFTSLSGETLRSFFQGNQSIFRIVDFGSTKVFNVQTYTAVTFLNTQHNESIAYSRIVHGDRPQDYLSTAEFTPNSYTKLSSKKWRLLCGEERGNIERIEHCGEQIGSLFNICAGIATLKDEVYFIQPQGEDETFYHITRNGRAFKIEKEVTRPLVKISDAKRQADIQANSRRIIFPYTEKKGKAVVIDETDMAHKYPSCYEYLLCVKGELEKRDKGRRTYTPFYAYGRTQGLNRHGVKLLTPTFSKQPRFLRDDNSQGFFTNGYGIFLKDGGNSLFSNPMGNGENLDVILKVLNSVVMAYYVEKTSVAIEGGYPCYQKNFIERFAVPDFSQQEIDTLRRTEHKEEIDRFLIGKYHLNLPVPKRAS